MGPKNERRGLEDQTEIKAGSDTAERCQQSQPQIFSASDLRLPAIHSCGTNDCGNKLPIPAVCVRSKGSPWDLRTIEATFFWRKCATRSQRASPIRGARNPPTRPAGALEACSAAAATASGNHHWRLFPATWGRHNLKVAGFYALLGWFASRSNGPIPSSRTAPETCLWSAYLPLLRPAIR